MAASSAATQAAGGEATVDGVYHDTPHELFIRNIREGRLDSDGNTKASWPLQEFVINCPGEPSTEGVDYLPAGLAANAGGVQSDLTDDQKRYMYAHCVAQFQFASVGTQAWEGTYGIPLPGIEAGPAFYPYPQVDGFNSSSSYTTRARMYLGQRFGLSIWAYVPMFLATCFLLGDCVVFFFAEALMPVTLADQANFESDAYENWLDSLVIAATTRSSRRKRLAIGFVAVLASVLFYAIFIAAPWGFFYTSLPRPICEKEAGVAVGNVTAPDHVGASPHLGVPQTWWKGTQGGWRTDYDATWYDLAALLFQIVVLFLLPLTTTDMCRGLNGRAADDAGVRQAAERVHNDAAYRFTQRRLVLPMVVGILTIIVGQSASGARFGMAWAEGVVAQETNHDQSGWLFDEVAISEHVYDQTVATLAAVTACGLIFAVAMQRHLINGVGCFSAGLFFGWVALVAACGAVLVFYTMSRSIFTEAKANEDCAVFPRSSHKFENDLCVSRFWTLLFGGALFLGAVGVMTVLGLLEAFPALFAARKSAWVRVAPPQEQDALPPELAAMTALQPKTRAATANEFLYGGKLKAPRARR